MLKKTIILILIIATVLSVSYLFPTYDIETEIACYGHSTSSRGEYITVFLLYNESPKYSQDPDSYIPLRDMPLSINLTDDEDKTESYNMTTNAKGQARIMSLEKRNYHVSVIFEGKYNYNPSRWEGDVDLKNQNTSYSQKYFDFNL